MSTKKDIGRWCWDIEVYPNFFSASFINYDTEERKYFEISHRKNDADYLCKFAKQIKYLIGFNSIHYDDIHLFFLLKHRNNNQKYLNESLHEITKAIIERDDYEYYKKYKYKPDNLKLTQIDLYLYWSKMLRISKMLSLKSLAVQLRMNNIQELPIKPGTILTEEQMDQIIPYNFNDVEVTLNLAKIMSDDINLRLKIEKEYGIKCISRDSVNMGSDIFLKLYCEHTKKPKSEVREQRTIRNSVSIQDILVDTISLRSDNKGKIVDTSKKKHKIIFKSFGDLLNELKNKTVFSTNEISYSVIYKDVKYDYGSGGIHAIGSKPIYESNDDYVIIDADVGSMYPSFVCAYEKYPEHLGKDWTNLYDKLRVERMKAKKTDPLKASVYKLILNGSYGLFNNQYSWLYDWKLTLQVTLNCQLLLTMLIEKLLDEGIFVYTANTDGVTSYVRRDMVDKYYEICKQWEKDTKLILEYDTYDKTVMTNVNNYIWIKGDKSKKKGLFVTKPLLGNSNDNLVIPKALEAYYMYNTPIEKFIRNHDNIYDFCAAPKIAKSFTVIWMNKKQQQLNRFYVSKSGGYLYKQKGEGNLENVLKGYAVQLFNRYEKKVMSEYKINYDWYITKCREIIEELEPRQKVLF